MGDTWRPRHDGRGPDTRLSDEYSGGGRRAYRRSPSPRDYGRRPDSYHPEAPRGSGFAFRGAADSRPQDQSRSTFTFEASGGPQAPHFPQEQPQQRPSRQGGPPNRGAHGGRGHRGDRGGRDRYQPRKFVPKPAHSRDLLQNNNRETTPEQMEGMNAESQPRYAEYISSDESDGDDEQGNARKRTKVEVVTESARPMWSNPDPYSVLPPTDLGLVPKKDIVQTIRKAKVEMSKQESAANAVKENVDFISFDSDNEKKEVQMDEEVPSDDEGELEEYIPPPPPEEIPPPPPDDTIDLTSDSDEVATKALMSEATSKKRNRGAESSVRPKGVVDDWLAKPGQTPSPWYDESWGSSCKSAFQLLDKEIISFFRFVAPLPHEEQLRREIIDRIEYEVRGHDPAYDCDVQIRCFGSFASGLYLPVADMDLVAVSHDFMAMGQKQFCQSPNAIHKMAKHLRQSGIAKQGSVVAIVGARVPILKLVDYHTDVKVDISFENESGLIANQTVRDWKQDYPAMPILVAFIKQLLAMRNLNEVHTGGLGGFSIICLVVSLLQHTPREELDNPNYADLLLSFLDFYGHEFDFTRTGIKLVPPERFNKIDTGGAGRGKRKRGGGFTQPTRLTYKMNRLTIVDPNNPANDIAGGSSNIEGVLESFRVAHAQIQACLGEIGRGEREPTSILECVLGGDYSLYTQQRKHFEGLARNARSRPQQQQPAYDSYSQAPAQSYGQSRHPAQNASGYRPYQAPQHLPPRPPQSFPQSTHHTHGLPPRPPVPTPANHFHSINQPQQISQPKTKNAKAAKGNSKQSQAPVSTNGASKMTRKEKSKIFRASNPPKPNKTKNNNKKKKKDAATKNTQ